jgi:hypothetical protein
LKVSHGEARAQEGPWMLCEAHRFALDVPLFAASMNVQHHEARAAAAFVRFNRNHMLVLLRPNLQLGDRTAIVPFTFHRLGRLLFSLIVVIHISVAATMLASVAFDHLAVFL